MPINLIIKRINNLVKPICFVPVQVFRLAYCACERQRAHPGTTMGNTRTSMPTVMEEQRIVRSRIPYEPLHGGYHILACRYLTRIRSFICEEDYIVFLIPELTCPRSGSYGMRDLTIRC